MKIYYKVPEKISSKNTYAFLASWFGCGYMNPAPGTWGSLGAIPFGLLMYYFGGPILLITAIFFIFPISLWAAHEFGKTVEEHDAKQIVIDEVIGIWIAMIPAALNPILVLCAFISFRLFDILKPWPVSYADKNIPNAFGVILDDIFAGLYAFVCVIALEALI